MDSGPVPHAPRTAPDTFRLHSSTHREFAELTATVKESSVMKSKRLLICRNQARPAQGSYGRKARGVFCLRTSVEA